MNKDLIISTEKASSKNPESVITFRIGREDSPTAVLILSGSTSFSLYYVDGILDGVGVGTIEEAARDLGLEEALPLFIEPLCVMDSVDHDVPWVDSHSSGAEVGGL